jgi:hypothetical protein
MTTIFCSHKLKQFYGVNNFTNLTPHVPSPFGDWNGHLFYINRKKHLIFVNNKTYYTVLIADVTKKDLSNFQQLFIERFIGQLIFDKVIKPADSLILLQKNLPVHFASTNNDQKSLGIIRNQILAYSETDGIPYHMDKTIAERNHFLNDAPTSAGQKSWKYSFPIENMRRLYEGI